MTGHTTNQPQSLDEQELRQALLELWKHGLADDNIVDSLLECEQLILAQKHRWQIEARIDECSFLVTDLRTYKGLKTDLDKTLLERYDSLKSQLTAQGGDES